MEKGRKKVFKPNGLIRISVVYFYQVQNRLPATSITRSRKFSAMKDSTFVL